jgi:VanZ family protein
MGMSWADSSWAISSWAISSWADSPVVAARSSWAPVVLAVFVAVPLAIAIAAWLTRHRRQAGWGHAWAARSAWAEIFMIMGTLPWVCLTLLPSHDGRGANLEPFRDLAQQVAHGHVYATVQIGGNLLVFAALGFGLPIRWRVGPLAALVVGAWGSTAIESLQWILNLGRYSSVDDVLVNAAGAVIAALLAWPWWRRRIGPVVGHPPRGGRDAAKLARSSDADVTVSV